MKRDGTVGIDAPDDHEFAPIHYAAKFNCFRILKLLVENGAGRCLCLWVVGGGRPGGLDGGCVCVFEGRCSCVCV